MARARRDRGPRQTSEACTCPRWWKRLGAVRSSQMIMDGLLGGESRFTQQELERRLGGAAGLSERIEVVQVRAVKQVQGAPQLWPTIAQCGVSFPRRADHEDWDWTKLFPLWCGDCLRGPERTVGRDARKPTSYRLPPVHGHRGGQPCDRWRPAI